MSVPFENRSSKRLNERRRKAASQKKPLVSKPKPGRKPDDSKTNQSAVSEFADRSLGEYQRMFSNKIYSGNLIPVGGRNATRANVSGANWTCCRRTNWPRTACLSAGSDTKCTPVYNPTGSFGVRFPGIFRLFGWRRRIFGPYVIHGGGCMWYATGVRSSWCCIVRVPRELRCTSLDIRPVRGGKGRGMGQGRGDGHRGWRSWDATTTERYMPTSANTWLKTRDKRHCFRVEMHIPARVLPPSPRIICSTLQYASLYVVQSPCRFLTAWCIPVRDNHNLK